MQSQIFLKNRFYFKCCFLPLWKKFSKDQKWRCENRQEQSVRRFHTACGPCFSWFCTNSEPEPQEYRTKQIKIYNKNSLIEIL